MNALAPFIDDSINGLSMSQKTLLPKYLYDEKGSL